MEAIAAETNQNQNGKAGIYYTIPLWTEANLKMWYWNVQEEFSRQYLIILSTSSDSKVYEPTTK